MAARVRPSLGDDPNRLMLQSIDQFDLGAFAPRLKQIYAGIKQGSGIALIKGLPIDELALIDVATIYWGIGDIKPVKRWIIIVISRMSLA